MKFYSEVLEQVFDTQEDLQKAEADFEKANANKTALKNKIFLHMRKGISEVEKARNYAEQYAEVATDDEALEMIGELMEYILECTSKMGVDCKFFRI